jgi:hypothetical protein
MSDVSTVDHMPRRLRMATLNEQQQFMQVAEQLRGTGMTDAELQRELGYEEADALAAALRTGRVTVNRLERLRDVARARLGAESLAPQKTEEEPATAPAATPSPASPRKRRGRKRAPAQGKVRQFLTPKQHTRLREQVEHLWAVDKRFRNWSMLARVMGLSSGQAAKRAYDVNSSMTTLTNLERFGRLHAAYGGRATQALSAGIRTEQLQAHLQGGAAVPSEAAPAPQRAAKAAPEAPDIVARATSLSELAEVPNGLEFASVLELGRAIDTEIDRMHQQARFFDGLARMETLPRIIRTSAAGVRDRLREALAFLTGEAAAGAGDVAPGGGSGDEAAS